MKVSLSRRTFLTALGGGLAAGSALWALSGSPYWGGILGGGAAVEECCSYVDHDGWMLTVADKERLIAGRQIRQLEHTSLSGGDIESMEVADAAACAAWCLSEERCRSFTYATTAHPESDMRSTCWIKGATDLPATADPFYTSGIVE